jgi:hypothetical protein
LALLIGLALSVAVIWEAQTSSLQSWFFGRWSATLHYTIEPGASAARCPQAPCSNAQPGDPPGKGGRMLFDFTEAERNTARRALELYVSELKDEIGKTERHEWRESLRLEREILERVIEQLSI